MLIPSASADSSLYQSSGHYRSSTAASAGGVRLAGYRDGWCDYDKCADCKWQCSLSGGYPFECKVLCRNSCKGCRP